MARRSATESAAILDAYRCLKLHDSAHLQQSRKLLVRIAAMLTAMVLRLNESGSRSG